MAGLIGEFVNRDNIGNPDAPLTNVRDVEIVETDLETYVYVAAAGEQQITVFTLDDQGNLDYRSALDTTTYLYDHNYDEGFTLTEIETANGRFLLAGLKNYGFNVFSIADDGSLTFKENMPGQSFVYEDFLLYGLEEYEFNGTQYFAIAGADDKGVSLYTMDVDGNFEFSASFGDFTEGHDLSFASGVEFVEANGELYLALGDWGFNSMYLLKVEPDGSLSFSDKVVSSADADVNIEGIWGIASATIGDNPILLVGARDDDTLSSFTISVSGKLVHENELSAPNNLYESWDVRPVTIDGKPYFLVHTDSSQSSVLLVEVAANGEISIVETFTDDDKTYLDRALHSDSYEVDGRHFTVVSGNKDNGISVLEIGGGHDALMGTEEDDVGHGLFGNDTIVTMGGDDEAFGGVGSDALFGGNGKDTLRGGDGDDVVSGDVGADSLLGGNDNDILIGGGGGDMLKGGAGDDTLGGNAGNDTLRGGDDNDRLAGHGGSDTLRGDAGDDLLFGGEGKDYLNGDAGNDTLFGGNGSDFLEGDSGDDRMAGGTGFDRYKTGSGNDIIVFKSGDQRDKVADFQDGFDRIDLTDFGFNSFNAVRNVSSQDGTRMRIDAGGGDVLLVENYNIANFDVADVIL